MKIFFTLFLAATIFFYSAVPLYAEGLDEIAIEGWSLEKIVKGKKAYCIEAERASFGNKRIGFFNLGIAKVINLDGVSLTLYNNGEVTKREHFNRAVYELNSRCLFDENGNLLFKEHREIQEAGLLPVKQEESRHSTEYPEDSPSAL